MHGSMRGFDSGRSSRRRMRYSEGKPRFRKLDHEPLSTTEDVPELLKEQVEALLETGEEIKISISTDLRFDGTYGKDWLLITNRRLIAFNQNMFSVTICARCLSHLSKGIGTTHPRENGIRYCA